MASSSTEAEAEAGREPPIQRWLVAAALLVPALLFLLASRGNWLFDFGGADNWQYVKYFLAWESGDPAMRAAMDRDYKGSRVPWIVLGHAAYALLGPMAGTVVLHAGVLLLSALFLYLLVALFFGGRVALAIAILAVCLPNFQASGVPGFWNYHGSAGNLYFLAGLYFTARAFAARRKLVLAALAGASLFAAFLTTFIYGALGPMLLAFAWTCWQRFGRQDLVRLLLAALAGAVLATLAFGLASFATGGTFWFFMSQIRFVMRATGNNVWAEPLAVWLPTAGWLALTLATALASIPFLLAAWRGVPGRNRIALGFVLQFWLAELALVLCDLLGQNAFQVPYVHYVSIPSTLLALAAMGSAVFGEKLRQTHPLGVATLALLVLVPGQVLAGPGLRGGLAALPLYRFVLPACLALLAFLAACLLRRHRLAPFLALLGFLPMALAAFPAGPYAVTERCYPARAIFPAISEGSAFISSLGVTQMSGALWYPDEPRLRWSADCPALPLPQVAFPLRHAGLVRQLGTPGQPLLEAVRAGRPEQLRAVFIVSDEASATRLAREMAPLADRYDRLPPRRLQLGSGDVLVVQAYRQR
jgi:hypothetical protein